MRTEAQVRPQITEEFDLLEEKIARRGGAIIARTGDHFNELILTCDGEWKKKVGDLVTDVDIEDVLAELAYIRDKRFRKIVDSPSLSDEQIEKKKSKYLSNPIKKTILENMLIGSMRHVLWLR